MLVRGHIFLLLFFLHNIPLYVQSIDSFSRDLLHENTRKLFFSFFFFFPRKLFKIQISSSMPRFGKTWVVPRYCYFKILPWRL